MNVLSVLFLDHAHLLFPYGLGGFFKFNIEFFQIITIGCNSSSAWVTGVDPLKAIIRYVLVYKVIVKPNPLTMLFDTHPLDVSILHCLPLFLLQNKFHLPPLLKRELEDL